jgi:hypothetical protein
MTNPFAMQPHKEMTNSDTVAAAAWPALCRSRNTNRRLILLIVPDLAFIRASIRFRELCGRGADAADPAKVSPRSVRRLGSNQSLSNPNPQKVSLRRDSLGKVARPATPELSSR